MVFGLAPGSFAQFEREVIGERVRHEIAASKRKGICVRGPVPLGYTTVENFSRRSKQN
jgi:DNA invertase Pin-like site-specific DNA recombinase